MSSELTMADDKVDDKTGEEFSDPDLRQSDGHVGELKKKFDALERERDGLANEIAGRKTERDKLTQEIDSFREDESKTRDKIEALKREFERSQVAKKAAEAVAVRKADLEAEGFRLIRDSISAKIAADGAKAECAKWRSVLEEKESIVLNLEWEVEGLKQVKVEIDKKSKDLEKEIGVLELKEIEGKNKKIRVLEELRDEIAEKDKEIGEFRHKLGELQNVASERGCELEDWIKEKLNLEKALRESEEKARSMESNILELQEKVKEAESVMRSLKEKADEAVNEMDSEAKGLNGIKLQWHVVAGSTGAIAAAAVIIYVCYVKRA